MTLTPQQRLAAYEWAKERVGSRRGVCLILGDWYDKNHTDPCGFVEERFPEFWAQRPEGAVLFWWPLFDTASRLAALDRAIELVKEKL